MIILFLWLISQAYEKPNNTVAYEIVQLIMSETCISWDKCTKIDRYMWIWITDITAKFHAKDLTEVKIFQKVFFFFWGGGYFFEIPCIRTSAEVACWLSTEHAHLWFAGETSSVFIHCLIYEYMLKFHYCDFVKTYCVQQVFIKLK